MTPYSYYSVLSYWTVVFPIPSTELSLVQYNNPEWVDIEPDPFVDGKEYPKLKANQAKSLQLSIFEGHIKIALIVQFPTPTISTPPTSDSAGQSSQFLEVLYLALLGLIDSALPAAGLWAVAEKAFSYLVKLGPIIWWAISVPFLLLPHLMEHHGTPVVLTPSLFLKVLLDG
ncbi:hypothetical protein DSO57_1025192 [Entomophthora muscae]|uniref:Uncharacterized protein n=1 Tax=Entomophthora muscae TaxID=34485 RepID=A0ACC2UMR2_9FUNG|nr:hypothetical protein DSO57_1025192 [Entomophthora muscae]